MVLYCLVCGRIVHTARNYSRPSSATSGPTLHLTVSARGADTRQISVEHKIFSIMVLYCLVCGRFVHTARNYSRPSSATSGPTLHLTVSARGADTRQISVEHKIFSIMVLYCLVCGRFVHTARNYSRPSSATSGPTIHLTVSARGADTRKISVEHKIFSIMVLYCLVCGRFVHTARNYSRPSSATSGPTIHLTRERSRVYHSTSD
ncbi:hypothetical protein J6590_089160 [Homalodisca vitripennis]|nr:hypothetical protein J6590_089160 [Homalodisca vitripennis]